MPGRDDGEEHAHGKDQGRQPADLAEHVEVVAQTLTQTLALTLVQTLSLAQTLTLA